MKRNTYYPVHINHDEYYRDRLTERDLCYDFPGDEILIDGLHAMQTHFWRNNVPVDIPVVRVMNAAHFIAAYMFATTCSGDQAEYDVLAYGSIGHDKKLVLVTIIVLAAMLQRTEGFRANQCRNVLLDNRDPDFEEGITLYDRFLRSAEKRFAEEDFLIDIPALVQRNQELEYENIQLKTENRNLKCKYEFMENQQNIQYNIGTQNNYNGCTIKQYFYPTSTATPSEDVEPEPAEPQPSDDLFCGITQAAYDEGKAQIVEAELRSASVSAPKLVKAIRTNEALGYLDTQNLSSKDLFDLLNEHYQLPFKLRTFQIYRSK